MKNIIQIMFLVFAYCTNMYSQNDICSDFDNPNLPFDNWFVHSNANGLIINGTANLFSVPFNNLGLQVLSNPSFDTYLINNTSYIGDYSNYQGDDCFCFDFELTNNASIPVFPSIILASGFDPSQPIIWGINPKIAAKFTSNTLIHPGDPWTTICAPLGSCTSGNLPTNIQGEWTMLGNGNGNENCTDWQNLLHQVTDVMMHIDVQNLPNAGYNIDDVCILDCSQQVQTQDIGLTAIPSLDNTCFFTRNDTITVQINNFGSVDVSNIEVSYQRFGDSIITETYTGTIPSQNSILYTFLQTTDLSKSYNTNVKAWTNDPNDVDPINDTILHPINCISYDSLGTPYVSNQMVIKYSDNTTQFTRDTIRQNFKNADIVILDDITCNGIYLDLLSVPDSIWFNGNALLGAESQKEAMKSQGAGKESIDFNFIAKGSSTKHPQKLQASIIKKATQFPQQNNQNFTHPVKIILLDSGVDVDSDSIKPYLGMTDSCRVCPDLTNFFIGMDYVNEDFDPSDDNNHGTNVAGIIATHATRNNLNTKIIPLKVLDHQGMGTLWTICLGTVTAKFLKADIVNASLGWQGSSSTILDTLIRLLGEDCHGLFVTSAGNDTISNDLKPHWPSNYTITHNNVVSVTAWEDVNISGTGNSVYIPAAYANKGIQTVDVALNGEYNVIDIGEERTIRRGTSLSAAYFSALSAGFLSKSQHISAHEIKMISRSGIPIYENNSTNIAVGSSFYSSDTIYLSNWANNVPDNGSCIIDICVAPNLFNLKPKSSTIELSVYPNPFQNNITLEFELEEREEVHVWMYDVLGQPLNYRKETFSKGRHQLQWDDIAKGKNIPNGVYVIHIQTPRTSGRQLLIKQDHTLNSIKM